MQESKKIKKNINEEDSKKKKKERHIVTWTQQEDDILRDQITLHGTDNWAIIASKFNDKTTRQCRRRWYTYLNSDFKKGGWSPEEDLLLCEAQRIFGNRWTEIAKVVSGRTDNAVKNRFSTLQKKRAKYEALAKENSESFTTATKKRLLSKTDGILETLVPAKKMRRSHLPDHADKQMRLPFTVLAQNCHNINNLPVHHPVANAKEVLSDGQSDKIEGTFLKKDDPKVAALMQQAELLSSLAAKVNTENTEQSLENAWKVLKEFLNRGKENDILSYTMPDFDLQFEEFKGLVEDLRSSTEGSQPSWRQPDLYEESPASSEYSTGSTLMPHTTVDQIDEIQSIQKQENAVMSCTNEDQVEIFSCFDEQTLNEGVVTASTSAEFATPLQVTPMFRSLSATIPSPQFSESERNFLLKTLGMESPATNPSDDPSQPPPCKRALLHSAFYYLEHILTRVPSFLLVRFCRVSPLISNLENATILLFVFSQHPNWFWMLLHFPANLWPRFVFLYRPASESVTIDRQLANIKEKKRRKGGLTR
ncbi:hypothetical protein ACFE04_022439 [Oxalis oulophora]